MIAPWYLKNILTAIMGGEFPGSTLDNPRDASDRRGRRDTNKQKGFFHISAYTGTPFKIILLSMKKEISYGGKIYISTKDAAVLTGYTSDYIGDLARAGTLPSRMVGRVRYVEKDAALGYQEKRSSIIVEGRAYISTKEAAVLTGYTSDYIGQLCRKGVIATALVGKDRYVSEEEVFSYAQKGGKDIAEKSDKQTSFGTARLSEEKEQEGMRESGQEKHYAQFTYEAEETVILPLLKKDVPQSARIVIENNKKIQKSDGLADKIHSGVTKKDSKNSITTHSSFYFAKMAVGVFAVLLLLSGTIGFVRDAGFRALRSVHTQLAAVPAGFVADNFIDSAAIRVFCTVRYFVGTRTCPVATPSPIVVVEEPIVPGTVVQETPAPVIITREITIHEPERVIERVVSSVPLQSAAGVTQDQLQSAIDSLNNSLRTEIYRIGASSNGAPYVPPVSNFSPIALTNNIDQLNNVTLTNVTFSGTVSGLSLDYLPLAGGTLTGALIGTDATFDTLVVNASTTFNGIEYLYPSADGSANQVLTTNGAGGLSWTTVSGGSGSDANWTFFNTSGVRLATTTNQVLVGASATTTTATLEVFGDIAASFFTATSTTATSTFVNVSFTDATTTELRALNASTTNFFASGLARFTDTIFNSLAVFNSGITVYNASSTITNLTTVNATSTNATTTNLAVIGNATTNALTITGLDGPLQANGGVVSATTSVGVLYGGTGWTNVQANTVLLGNGTGALATTTAGTDGQVLALVSGIPSWVATTTLADIAGTLSIANGGTGTTTSVAGGIFFSDGSTFKQDSTNLFWDDSNNRLGIGTTSPYTDLSISGAAPRITIDNTNGGGRPYQIRNGFLSTGLLDVFDVTASTTRFAIDSTGNTAVGTSTINEAKLFVYGGANVDIRTATNLENATVEVQADDYETSFQSAYLQYVGSGIAGNVFGSVPNADLARLVFQEPANAAIYTTNSSPIIFGVNSLESARLSADGNFGIGTTSPYAKLSVVGETVSEYFTATSSTPSTFAGGLVSQAYSTITSLFATNASTTNATSTNLDITGLLTFDSVTGNQWSDFCTSITGGAGLCDGTDDVGSGVDGFDFSYEQDIGYGLTGSATTTTTQFTAGIHASSTSHFSNASTTLLTAPDAWITRIRNLTDNGFVTTANGDGTLSVDTTTYTPTTRALTIAGTANQITSSAGAQDLSADRTWTLSLPNHVIFPGSYVASSGTTTNATSTNLTVTGNTILENITSALVVTGSGGAIAEYAGTSCTNQFVRALDALGVATCASVALGSDVSGTLPIANGGTGTTTSVAGGIFFSDGSTFKQDSANLFWDDSNNRLGVGSTTPFYPLSVTGTTSVQHLIIAGDYPNQAGILQIRADPDFNLRPSIQSGSVTSPTAEGNITFATGNNPIFEVSSGENNDFYLISDSTYRLFVNTTTELLTISSETGNMGISTTSPYAKFSIHANPTDTSINTTLFSIASSTASATTTHFVVENTGRVGIGTTSPYAKLSVVGETVSEYYTATSASATSTFPRVTVATGISLMGEYFENFTTYVRSLFTGGTGIALSSGDISFDCSEVEGTGINCIGEAITLDATGDWTGTLDSLEASQFLRSDTADEAAGLITFSAGFLSTASSTIGDGTQAGGLSISGGATTTGNIALTTANSVISGDTGLTLQQTGDTFGTTRLHIQNRVGVNGAMFEQAGSVDLVDFVFKSLSNQRNIRFEDRSAQTFAGDPEFQIGTGGNPTLVIGDSVSAFRNGNVGVGTTSPWAKLSVHGRPTDSDVTQPLFVVATSTPSATTTVFMIDASGKVGIGSSATPSADLHIHGDGDVILDEQGDGVSALLFHHSGSGNALIRSSGTDALALYSTFTGDVTSKGIIMDSNGVSINDPTPDGTHLEVSADGTSGDAALWISSDDNGNGDLFSVLESGFVGIGVAAPSELLHIYRNDTDTGETLRIEQDSTGDASLAFTLTSTRSYGVGIDNSDADAFKIDNSGSGFASAEFEIQTGGDVILVESGGDVGIGTAAPANRLDVRVDDATTNAVVYPLRLEHTTTGTVANGIGTGIDFYTEWNGGTYRAAHIDAVDTNVTNGDTALSLYINKGGVGNTEAVTINGSGVGIFDSSPTEGTLTVGGTLYVNSNSAVGTDPLCWDGSGGSLHGDCTSLAQYKTNIRDLDLNLDTLLALKPRRFNWIEDFGGEDDLGFIAEEVAAVDPLLARSDRETGELQGVKYERLTSLIVKAIQELVASIDERFASVEERLTALEYKDGAITTTAGDVVAHLSEFGVSISQGLARFVSVVAESISSNTVYVNAALTVGTQEAPTGITLFDPNGAPYCVRVAEGGALVSKSGECVAGAPLMDSITGDITPPVITILGNNPAVIDIGTSYADLGATALDDVDGERFVDVEGAEIDTSIDAVYDIVYTARDVAGNTSIAHRSVVVGLGAPLDLSEHEMASSTADIFEEETQAISAPEGLSDTGTETMDEGIAQPVATSTEQGSAVEETSTRTATTTATTTVPQ